MAIADVKELRRKHTEHEKALRKAERLAGIDVLRDRDAVRKREQRQQERLVIIPRCKDRDRREALEDNDVNWLYYYFSLKSGVHDPFWYRFTNQQHAMIESFGDAIKFGGDQSVAASRGEGKTTLLERLILKYTLQGLLPYSVLFQATGGLAINSLDSIKQAIEETELLHDDYPEACVPVRALENTPQRAHYQVVSGDRHDNLEPFEMALSRFTWCGHEIIFPKVPGSPSSVAIIATRGLDAAARGLKKRGRRPALAAIDDPDTDKTVSSEGQAKKLEERIDKTIGGLGSQSKPVSRIFLGTIQSRIACAYKYTDPKEKPSWKGKRFRYVITPPDNAALWDEYVEIRSEEFRAYAAEKSTDKHCRKSHKFYLDNRERMDAGAVVANEHRFNPEVLPDGTQVEVSSLQHFYNEVTRLGSDAAEAEYNNDPPKEIGVTESTIDAIKIQHRLSGYERRVVPPGCTILTQGIDVRKTELHWVIKAWRADATNYVIDHGIFDTQGTTYGSDEGVELAIRRAILGRMEEMREETYATLDSVNADGEKIEGDKREVGLTLVDSGWQAPAVYQACLEIGLGIFPAKGHGKSHGCATPNFYDILKHTKDRKPGDGFFLSRQPSGVWLAHCDTDRWKSFEHARWQTTEGKPGAAYLFGEMTDEERKNLEKRMPKESKVHFTFARQLTAEIEVQELVRGSLKWMWKAKGRRVQNHYLDASYLADVAAAMLDVKLLPAVVAPEQPKRPAVLSAGHTSQARW